MRAIHLAKLDKTRPVLVLTRVATQSKMPNVTVASITSTVRGLASEVPVGPRNGLDNPSVVACDVIEVLPQDALGRRIGYLMSDQEPALARAIVHAFDLHVEELP